MRILIAGGAGFIGSHFCKWVQKHHPSWEITVVDALTYAARRDNLTGIRYEFHHLSICDEVGLIPIVEDADYVVNFAAETHVDNSIINARPFLETNVIGLKCLFNACRKAKRLKKIIHISTDEVYGSRERFIYDSSKRKSLNINFAAWEAEILKPGNPYAASKAAGDMLYRAYINTFNLPITVVRPVNNYGTHQYSEKFIPATVKRIVRGEPALVYDTGKEERDWLYVEDCCDALGLILKKGKVHEIYNIGAHQHRKNIDVVKKIFKTMGVPEKIVHKKNARPGHDKCYAVDDARVRAMGWWNKHYFEDTFPEVVKWYVARYK